MSPHSLCLFFEVIGSGKWLVYCLLMIRIVKYVLLIVSVYKLNKTLRLYYDWTYCSTHFKGIWDLSPLTFWLSLKAGALEVWIAYKLDWIDNSNSRNNEPGLRVSFGNYGQSRPTRVLAVLSDEIKHKMRASVLWCSTFLNRICFWLFINKQSGGLEMVVGWGFLAN